MGSVIVYGSHTNSEQFHCMNMVCVQSLASIGDCIDAVREP